MIELERKDFGTKKIAERLRAETSHERIDQLERDYDSPSINLRDRQALLKISHLADHSSDNDDLKIYLQDEKERLLYKDEREKRIATIRNSSDEDRIIPSLKWMSQKGGYQDVEILLNALYDLPLSPEAIELTNYAIKCISAREYEERQKNYPATLERIKTPSTDESEEVRNERRERVFRYAIEVFTGEQNAQQWLSSSRAELNGLTPNDVLVTEEGAEIVEQMLGRIDHGIYS